MQPEIKIHIAVQHPMAWIGLVQADREFYLFSITPYGISLRSKHFATVETNSYVTIHKLFGQLHRDDDLPAIIGVDGSRQWFQHGKKHRDNDLPAVIYANGSQLWYRHNQLHRDNDPPAIIYADGTQRWYQNGEFIK